MTTDEKWSAVRCVFRAVHDGQQIYEERITLWRTADLDAAIALAEAEAREYATLLNDGKYLGLAQAYHLGEHPGHGAEVFSLIRQSGLLPDEYLDLFFDTGREYQADSAGREREHRSGGNL